MRKTSACSYYVRVLYYFFYFTFSYELIQKCYELFSFLLQILHIGPALKELKEYRDKNSKGTLA